MKREISEALKRLADEHEHATTQKERDGLWREIVCVSYKQERDREGAHRRDTDIGRFEASMLSLDAHMAKFDDPSKIAAFSDGGKGDDDMAGRIDGETQGESYYTRCAEDARERLGAFDQRLVTVFDLVVKNGNNREESICELAARDKHGKKEAKDRYSRNLEEILKFFLSQ